MNSDKKIKKRKKSIAAIASGALPGLGQLYNGEVLKGVCMFFIFLMVPVAGLTITTYFPDRLLMPGVFCMLVATLLIAAWSVVDAFVKASRIGEGYTVKSYHRWNFYCAIWIAGSVFMSTCVFSYINTHVIQFCSIPSASMEPAIQRGDFIIIDKKAYSRMSPKRNDIIIFVYPDDRSKIYIKRVAGLPGDTMKTDSSRVCIVPHGFVYVLGDNRDHARDSRVFGPVPLCDVVGKARQIYFSVGNIGVRWERIGKTL
jgi:signal peptidase I